MRKNKVLTAFFVIGCIAVVGIAGIVTLFAKDNFGNKNLICDGISIGSLDVGGLTQEQAQKKVDDYIAKRRQQKLVVTVQENQIEAQPQRQVLRLQRAIMPQRHFRLVRRAIFGRSFRRFVRQRQESVILRSRPR